VVAHDIGKRRRHHGGDSAAEVAAKSRLRYFLTMEAAGDLPFNLYKPQAPLPVTVVANQPLTPSTAPEQEVRHIVLAWPAGTFRFREGQSVGIPPPGLNARGRPHPPRLYSIASPRTGEDGAGTTLALTVKRFFFGDDESGQRLPGKSSNFLCDAQPGDVVRMTGPAGKDLLLPDDLSAPLLLIATGTGIAPYRAFALRRLGPQLEAGAGPMWLVFGARRQQDVLYAPLWHDLAASAAPFRCTLALSREQTTAAGGRMHVQDRLLEHAAEVWRFVQQPAAHVYVCGIKGMEFPVEAAFAAIAGQHGADWAGLLATLRAERRWRVETY
jgi:ferredoxin--NADP+ reductase